MLDLTLPGYKYLGPGNKLDKGLPNNHNDLVAFFHDVGYGEIEDRGGNPYLQWSEADAKAYKEFISGGLRGTDVDRSKADYGGGAGKGYFGLKKLAYAVGAISKFEFGTSCLFYDYLLIRIWILELNVGLNVKND